MSNTRPSLYSSHYFELLNRVMQGEVIRVPCPSLAIAQRLRGRFYKFRRSLATRPEHEEEGQKADMVLASVRLVDGSYSVVFENRDDTEESRLLAQALAQSNGNQEDK